MKYISVAEAAKRWQVSERTARNYCAAGKIAEAFLTGKTWNLPETAQRPDRINKKRETPRSLLQVLKTEKNGNIRGGIYHKVQIELTYNSNHIEGSRLTHEQTRFIYETNTIGMNDGVMNVDDILETVNHFRCIDLIIENATRPVSEAMIKQLHRILKNGTSDSRKEWFAVGAYKKLPNEVGGKETTPPELVAEQMKALLASFNQKKHVTLQDLLAFHVVFETIHPFQDGNGRVGRLLLFKECLRFNMTPFIIDEELKLFYYRGLQKWKKEPGYLMDTCLAAQDKFKKYLEYFRIPYEK